MKAVLDKLYSNEYFGLILLISIVILIVVFLIVLFLGKKDQKKREIETTRKLEQINSDDAFKEENTEQKIEINNDLSPEYLESNTIAVPTIESLENVNNENGEIVENIEEMPAKEEPVQLETFENPVETLDDAIKLEEANEVNNNVNVIPEVEVPLLERIEEKPLVFDTPVIEPIIFNNEIEKKEEQSETNVVPEFNLDEIVQSAKDIEPEVKVEVEIPKSPQIFSSVYVPEPPVIEPQLTEHSEEPEKEIQKEVPEVPSDVELLDLELPTLKKDYSEKSESIEKEESKIEIPVLKDFSIDDISGETYDLNK